MSTTCIGRMASANGCVLTMARASDAAAFMPGSIVNWSSSAPGPARPGWARVDASNCDIGTVTIDRQVSLACPTATAGDWLFLQEDRETIEADQDMRAVESYLMSCVRRRDWHGVSDAANDLRVLEARRDARAGR